MSLPKTTKQAVFKAQGEPLTIEDAPMPNPAKGEILIKVEACGVCHSDLFTQGGFMGGGFPIVPGHEIIGRVVALGQDVSRWSIGDRVGGGWHGGHDGTCKACRMGLNQMCDNAVVNGVTRSGGYSQYATLRAEAAAAVPDDVDAASYAPILCAGVTMFNSMRQAKIPVGETVAVQGLGGLGHLAIQYANKFGYRVVAVSRGADKEKFARSLGAHEYVDTEKGDAGEALAKLGGASLIMTTNPNPDSIPPLIKGLAPLGKLLILSVPGDITVNVASLLRYGCSIQSWPSGQQQDSEDAIRFTQLEGIKCMVEKFPLEKANDAFQAMLKGTVRFRAVIVME